MSVFVYDSDCSFCSRFATWAESRTTVTVTDHGEIPGVDPEEYLRHAVFYDGTVYRGHRAIGSLLATMGTPWRIIGTIINARVLSPVASRVYRYVADRRPTTCRRG